MLKIGLAKWYFLFVFTAAHSKLQIIIEFTFCTCNGILTYSPNIAFRRFSVKNSNLITNFLILLLFFDLASKQEFEILLSITQYLTFFAEQNKFWVQIEKR